jgi:hypothetical protein
MSEDYEVRYLGRSEEKFGDYLFEIWSGPDRIAEFRHDFRGEEGAIRAGGDWVWCDYPFEGVRPWRVSESGRRTLAALRAGRDPIVHA